MSDLSKRALGAALMDTLRTKPFEKITVLELTKKCGLTRNVFYYHFQDIYDLLQYVFESEIATLEQHYSSNRNWEGGLEQGLIYMYNHKPALRNLYQSINQGLIIKYLNNIAQEHIVAVISAAMDEYGYQIEEQTLNTVAKFYKDTLMGGITEWLVSDMDTDPVILSRYFDVMFTGTLESALKSADTITGSEK